MARLASQVVHGEAALPPARRVHTNSNNNDNNSNNTINTIIIIIIIVVST